MNYLKSCLKWGLGCLLLSNMVYAQSSPVPPQPGVPTGEDYVPPVTTAVLPSAPTAASLGKYGTYEVSTYSGVPNIDIPLFTVPGRHTNLPISLSYHASGIKVEERSSWVGMGWSLVVGGSITRTVKGVADELPFGYLNKPQDMALLDNIISPNNEQLGFLDRITKGIGDASPDVFAFRFGSYSGEFIFDRDGIPRMKDHQNIKIIRVDESEFQLITPDGVTYRFGRDANGNSAVDVVTSATLAFGPSQPEVGYSTAWHLTEILHPNGEGNIQLFYGHDMNVKTVSTVHTRVERKVGYASWLIQKKIQKSTSTTTNNVKLPSKIEFPTGTVEFIPEYGREDLLSTSGQQFRLKEIVVKDLAGNIKKSIELDAGYYNDHVQQDTWDHKRLRLDRVKLFGKNKVSSQDYTFAYNGDTPSYKSAGQDHWGYYNGMQGTIETRDMLPAIGQMGEAGYFPGLNRETNPTFIQAGMLEKITYPTQGYTEFDFEANQVIRTYGIEAPTFVQKAYARGAETAWPLPYSADQSESALMDILTTEGIESKCVVESACPQDGNFDNCYYNCVRQRASEIIKINPNAARVMHNGEQCVKAKLTVQTILASILHDETKPWNAEASGFPPEPMWGLYNRTDDEWVDVFNYNDHFDNVLDRTGQNRDTYPGLDEDVITGLVTRSKDVYLHETDEYELVALALHHQEIVANVTLEQTIGMPSSGWENKVVGGLRVRRIASYEADGTLLTEKNYTYLKEAQEDEDEEQASGVTTGMDPEYVYNYKVASLLEGHPSETDAYKLDEYIGRTARSRTAVQDGAVVGYSRVTEYFGQQYRSADQSEDDELRNAGKIVYEYYQGEGPRKGKLRKQTTYKRKADDSYEKVSTVEYIYDFSSIGTENGPYAQKITGFEVKRQLTSVSYADLYVNPFLRSHLFDIRPVETKCGWSPLVQEIHTTYEYLENAAGNVFENTLKTTTDYTYGNYRHAMPTEVLVTYPDGSQDKTVNRYAHDFIFDGCEVEDWDCDRSHYKSCFDTYRLCEDNKRSTCDEYENEYRAVFNTMELMYGNCNGHLNMACLIEKGAFYKTFVKPKVDLWQTCLSSSLCYDDLRTCLANSPGCSQNFDLCQLEKYETSSPRMQAVLDMQQKNIIDRPIETESWKREANGDFVLEDAYFIEFESINFELVPADEGMDKKGKESYNSRQVVPRRVYHFQNANATFTGLQLIQQNGEYDLVMDPLYELMMTYDDYDLYGNVRQFTAAHQPTQAIQWANEGTSARATALNAPVSNDPIGNSFSYLGFEENDSEIGRDYWTLNEGNMHIGSDGKTGKAARYVLAMKRGPERLFLPDDQEGRFVLSAWVKTSPTFQQDKGKLVLQTVNANLETEDLFPNVAANDVQVTFGATNGEWKYVEAEIDLGLLRTQGNLTSEDQLMIYAAVHNLDPIKGLVIDDIRFRPALSVVETVEVAPLEGVISTSSQQEQAQHYMYDDFGRLERALDDQKRILAKYRYNFAASSN